MAITPNAEDQKALYAEADARFWAQTGYKPGQKLDPKNPLDAKMIPTYANIYSKVLREWQTGKLEWTFAKPAVVQLINDAKDLSAAAAAHMDAVVTAIADKTAPSSPEKAKHVQDQLALAQDAHAAAGQKTDAAAQHQPSTVSPTHVHEASHQVQQFVMTAGGQGVPISNGADAVGAMQATAAPGRFAVQNAPQDFGPSQYDLERGRGEPPREAAGGGKMSGLAIGGLVLASAIVAFGMFTLGGSAVKSRSTSYRAWPVMRAQPARTIARRAA
jgi:hypothetical protein